MHAQSSGEVRNDRSNRIESNRNRRFESADRRTAAAATATAAVIHSPHSIALLAPSHGSDRCSGFVWRSNEGAAQTAGSRRQAADGRPQSEPVGPATTGAVRPLGQPTGAERRALNSSRIRHSLQSRTTEINRRYSNKPVSSARARPNGSVVNESILAKQKNT